MSQIIKNQITRQLNNSLTKLSLLFLLVTLIITPITLHAQLEMNSQTYKLTDINFGSDVSLSITQDTIPPEIGSQGPIVTELEPRKAVIEWTTNKKASSTVYYGTSKDYGFENGSATFSVTHKITLFGLDPETLYHFKVVSVDPFGAIGAFADRTFTTPADAGINTIKVSDIGYDRALISWKTGNFTVSQVEYGTSIAYGQVRKTSSGTFSAEHTVQLTDLEPGGEYHFRIVAENEKGVAQRSNDQTFTTVPLPKFESVAAVPRSPNLVEVRWRTNTRTSGVVTYKAQDGPNVDTQTEASVALNTVHSVLLRNLIGDITYTFSVIATDERGSQVESSPQSFRTPIDRDPPVISHLNISVTRSGDELVLTVKWKTNEPAKGEVVYGPKNRADESINVPGSSNYITDHSIVATGLKPSTPYQLVAFSVDPSVNSGSSEINFVSPKFNKSIFQLIIDTFLSRFGWLANLFQR